jgi:hypothetical protein
MARALVQVRSALLHPLCRTACAVAMSADLLRRAAAKLREHAEAATPGPWEHVDHGPPTGSFMGCGQVITMGAEVFGGDIAGPTGDLYPRGGYSPLDDMALIALMGPPVASAIAELLSGTADDMGVEINEEGNCTRCGLRFDLRREDECMCWYQAFDVAHAVLREES